MLKADDCFCVLKAVKGSVEKSKTIAKHALGTVTRMSYLPFSYHVVCSNFRM